MLWIGTANPNTTTHVIPRENPLAKNNQHEPLKIPEYGVYIILT